MASNPPSGASRLPDILSFCRICLKVLMLLVRLMTCWKENGGSLFGHGSCNLTDRQVGRKRDRLKWGRKEEITLSFKKSIESRRTNVKKLSLIEKIR